MCEFLFQKYYFIPLEIESWGNIGGLSSVRPFLFIIFVKVIDASLK